MRLIIVILALGFFSCKHQQATIKSDNKSPALGIYDLDETKSNLHTYSDFKFELIKNDKFYKMKFVSCEKYGYSESWKPDMTFAIVDSLIDLFDNLNLNISYAQCIRAMAGKC